MKGQNEGLLLVLGVLSVIIFVAFIFGSPIWNVWAKEQQGKAEYAQAEYNRQISVLEAQAKLDSSKLLAQAEIEKAKGVAEANRILGESLEGKEAYLHYLWITEVAGHEQDKTIVYVPTEASFPILEAGRLP